MHIESESSFDVVVVGGGIAGCCAAIEAARAGASVCLASASGVFSGSSFYPGTWGLGLVGPRDAADIDDMVETILHVGRGAANAALVDSFVRGIPEAIAALEAMGVSLKRPANPNEPQYIPCFDHSLRMWRGLERDSMERGFGRALCEGGVVRFDGCELLDITMDGGCTRGALFFDRSLKRFRAVSCGAIVLAGGGVAGLYKRSLSASGNSATVQAIAAHCGARLVNLEFMQIMPGLVAPRRNIVFNEKAFRFARAWDASGEPIARDVLGARSEHGPFSCERAGAPLDFAMEACGDEGMEIACDVGGGSSEFVRTFSGWLERECGVSASAPVRIAPYAHASNGGIAIDEHGSCGVPGLFAAGECTGGMHGADRIGGLASANALVFGRRAGVAAAKFAREFVGECANARSETPGFASVGTLASGCGLDVGSCRDSDAEGIATKSDSHNGRCAGGSRFRSRCGSISFEVEERAYPASGAALRELRETMSTHCMISRDAEGLKAAASAISALRERVGEAAYAPVASFGSEYEPASELMSASGLAPSSSPCSDAASIAATMRIRLQFETASATVAAMLARKESCGSHYRSDAAR